MVDVVVPEAAPLVTIPGVELCAAGTWKITTGETTFSIADLAECVAALDCPGVRNPVIKLGHAETDGPGVRWDGEPALGWVDNMARSGAKLIGDLAGVPSWLAEVLPSAYPDRSVEMCRPFVCQIGHTHPAVITALALIGVSEPGVGVLKSLQDVAALYQVEPAPAPASAVSRARAVVVGGRVYLAAAAAPKELRRQLTAVEQAARTDFLGLQSRWEGHLHELVNDWGDVVSQMRDALGEQITSAVDGGKLDALAELFVDADDGGDLLAAAMEDEANDAADEMRQEAERQGVLVALWDIDFARLAEIARTTASLLANTLAVAAGRHAIQAATPGASGAQVAGQVAEHLSGLSEQWLVDQLGGALSMAQNTGRFAVLDAAPQAAYYASEVLDANTCEACADIDGHQFADLEEAQTAYAGGGFVDCAGGLRCRGIVVTVWDSGQAAAAGRVTVTVPFALRMEGSDEGHRIRFR